MWGAAVTNQNFIHGKIKRKLHLGNVCYHSFLKQSFCFTKSSCSSYSYSSSSLSSSSSFSPPPPPPDLLHLPVLPLLLLALQLHFLKVLAILTTSFHLTQSWMHFVQLFIFIILKSSGCITEV